MGYVKSYFTGAAPFWFYQGLAVIVSAQVVAIHLWMPEVDQFGLGAGMVSYGALQYLAWAALDSPWRQLRRIKDGEKL